MIRICCKEFFFDVNCCYIMRYFSIDKSLGGNIIYLKNN